MKKFFLHTLLGILTGTISVAQQFSPTFGSSACTNCVPTGYTISSGSPSISDSVGVGGQSQKAWVGSVPNPPSYTYNGNTKKTFVSLESSSIKKDKIKTTVGGFVAGYEYTLRYFVMSSRISTSGYGTEAELQVVTLDAFPAIISSKKTTFVPGSNVSIWIEQEINFKATASQLSFVFSGSSASGSSGFVNFDVSKSPFDCTIPGGQVQLFRNSVSTIFPCEGTNLYNLVKGTAPVGSKVVWRRSDNYLPALAPNMSVEEASNAGPGKYWAFYVTDEGCKNVYTSTASVEVKWVQTQVPLKANKLTVDSPVEDPKGDLYTLLENPNKEVRWFKSQMPLEANLVATPKYVGPGIYYAYYYNSSSNCYSLDINSQSTAKVTVEAAPCTGNGPTLIDMSDKFFCQGSQVVLNDFITSAPPAGLSVLWFDNDAHSGNAITTGVVNDGIYYAFYYDAANQCYSPSSPISILSEQVHLNCGEDGCDLSVGCPPTGVNLNALHIGEVPSGWELRWFNNTTHSGQQLANPTNVTQPGEYYSFYYNVAQQCYNKTGLQNGGDDVANKKVTITAPPCASGTKLSLRLALQGACELDSEGLIMHSNLQSYDTGSGVGLLPTATPYGGNEICPEINNQASKTERVVDWIKVEVRDAANPSVLLESKSLLLKPDGHVWGVDGVEPVFSAQPNPVRIVVRHRNHLAVISNPIQSFSSGTVSYDFTTALSQASNAFGDPPQMVLKNGIWCMWAGDVNAVQDLGIDATDSNEIYKINKQDASYDIYDATDINMDGGVDSNDRNLIYLNNLTGPISTVSNY